jgi:phage terminase large subunit-like protein
MCSLANLVLERSKADEFLALPENVRNQRLSQISDEGAEALLFDWDFWARPAQRAPQWDWIGWLVLAGRGFGKTRVGAEQVRVWVKDNPIVNLVAPTTQDIRDVMIEGPAGILAICPRGERPLYQPSKRRLVWPNGAVSLLFSADEPERLRGPQCYKAWLDEVAAWRYVEEAIDQLMFGLRLGESPQWCVTTTPKPIKVIKEWIKDPTVAVTRGSTYDNKHNLAKNFFNKIIRKYEGTRLGRQEIEAEVLEDNPNALWQRSQIDKLRRKLEQVPDLVRIVVAVDPAVTSEEESADTGIIGAARDGQDPPHYYVLADRTCHETPDRWAGITVDLFNELRADRVVGEVNNGGDLVEAVIRHKAPGIPFTAVRASRGKLVRAEPIAALYEQGRVHHIGSFPVLEDQLCDYVPGVSKSPDRMDAAVWALTELSQDDDGEEVVVHEEDVHISPDLDEAEMRLGL